MSQRCRYAPALILALAALGLACSDLVPPDTDFAAGRCATVLDDGVDGTPTWDLGAILEMTQPSGKPDPNGAFYARAMRLAVQELNDHRDISGKRVRIRICDTRSDWATGGGVVTRDLAKWLVEKQGVQAIISDASADTQTIASVTIPKGVLLMAISATSEDLTYLDDKGLVWRVAPSDLYQGAVLAKLATETLDAGDKVGAVAVQSPYGDGLVDAMRKRLGQQLVQRTFHTDGTGLEAAVAGLSADNPKTFVFAGSSSQAALALGFRAKVTGLATLPALLSDGACDKDLAAQKFDAAVTLQNARCVRPGQPPTETYQVFAERFKQRFGADPGEQAYTQHAFDAVYAVALAHAWATGTGGKGTVDGGALAEGLRHLSAGEPHVFKPNEITAMVSTLKKGQSIDVSGASGALDFNPETGEAPSGYEVWKLGPKGELQSNTFYLVGDLGGGKITVTPATP